MTDRQARLKALAARAGRIKEPQPEQHDDEVGDNGDNVSVKPALTFRNYAPKDASLDAANKRAAASADGDTAGEVINDDDDDDDGNSSRPSAKRSRTVATTTNLAADDDGDELAPTSRSALQDALREARREVKLNGTTNAVGITTTAAATDIINTVDVTALAPQKIDADLKTRIADKLAKLERRTQKSIVEMLKERLEMEAAREAEEGDGDGDESDLD